MKKWKILCCLPFWLACNNSGKPESKKSNEQFQNFSQQFIEHLWATYPEWATQQGFHKFDDSLSIPNEENRQAQKSFAQTHLDKLKQIDTLSLTDLEKIDFHLIKNHLQSILWRLEKKKDYQWDAAQYNVTGLIAYMLSEPYAPLNERLLRIINRLSQAPKYYQAASANLIENVPELVSLAQQQNEGGLSILTQDLKDSIRIADLPEETKIQMNQTLESAVVAIQSFVDFLKNKMPKTIRSFRLGKELYDQQFKFDIQSEQSATGLYQEALKRKAYLHQEMAKRSRSLWPKYFGDEKPPEDSLLLIKKVIDTLSNQHVAAADFQSAIEKQLPELVDFVNKKNLLYLDPSKPLVVRKEPAYMAGVAGASISAPGPYDTAGNTYYNVGSLNGWSEEKAISYLKEYNNYTLQILNIHEAIPGHYTQLVYANKSKSLIKSILANGAMIEGWAVYTEQMMLENEYGGDTPEMWLMWYKWNLRTVCNTILDYSVHVMNMNEEEAMHLLMQEAFQQETEAKGKWRRVNVTHVQLTSYFSGYNEIIKLREQWKQKTGNAFDLKKFNESFLSYGNAPVKYIKSIMMK